MDYCKALVLVLVAASCLAAAAAPGADRQLYSIWVRKTDYNIISYAPCSPVQTTVFESGNGHELMMWERPVAPVAYSGRNNTLILPMSRGTRVELLQLARGGAGGEVVGTLDICPSVFHDAILLHYFDETGLLLALRTRGDDHPEGFYLSLVDTNSKNWENVTTATDLFLVGPGWLNTLGGVVHDSVTDAVHFTFSDMSDKKPVVYLYTLAGRSLSRIALKENECMPSSIAFDPTTAQFPTVCSYVKYDAKSRSYNNVGTPKFGFLDVKSGLVKVVKDAIDTLDRRFLKDLGSTMLYEPKTKSVNVQMNADDYCEVLVSLDATTGEPICKSHDRHLPWLVALAPF